MLITTFAAELTSKKLVITQNTTHAAAATQTIPRLASTVSSSRLSENTLKNATHAPIIMTTSVTIIHSISPISIPSVDMRSSMEKQHTSATHITAKYETPIATRAVARYLHTNISHSAVRMPPHSCDIYLSAKIT